jgi:hypothetical protein
MTRYDSTSLRPEAEPDDVVRPGLAPRSRPAHLDAKSDPD